MDVLSRVLWKVHSKDHAVAATSSRQPAGPRSRQPRYTTIRDTTFELSPMRSTATTSCVQRPWTDHQSSSGAGVRPPPFATTGDPQVSTMRDSSRCGVRVTLDAAPGVKARS